MCGICGIISTQFDLENGNQIVSEMNDAIRHRGPDEDGRFEDEYCNLAMRRLSIIDLTGGKQPIYNSDKSIVAFLNGEIYNYRELKTDLEREGVAFYSKSDTEVLPHLYQKYGDQFISMLKGMFTFCIYDVREKRWLFARDRFGEKPFYYHYKAGYLTYSSEIDSLLKNSEVPRILNNGALPYYLSNTFVPEPETLFRDIYSLPPGHYMVYQSGNINITSYFEPNYIKDKSLKTEEDCVEYLNPILKNAVKRQMVSDVPIGAFLSGGIDSSTIVANMQEYSDKPIKTFTVRFDDAKYDESPIAREVAQMLGTDHHELTIQNRTFSEDIFWKIINHVGLPFPDSSAIPSFLISKEIRKFVSVALSGDGGDELFAGYPFYQWWQKVYNLRIIPQFIGNFASDTFTSVGWNQQPKIRQILRGIEANAGTANEIGARMSILFDPLEISQLIPNYKHSFERLSNFPAESDSWSIMNKSMYYRLKHDLPLDMLTKVDRMSMANSLEVRAPFLDPDLFDASTKIPDMFLIRQKKGKDIIRKIMKNRLPDSVFNHPKTGFSIPLHHYMNQIFEKLCQDLILNNNAMLRLFDEKALNFFVARGLSQKKDKELTAYRSSHQVWSLLQLGGWLKEYNVQIEE